MPMNLQAEVLRIRDVFSSGADLRVPPYQRGYAWGDTEVQALIKDLRDAFTQGTVYFVGAMVVIQTRKSGPSDVVDGQQRITTLTIILAVLRDLAASADEAASLHAMIGQGGFGWGSPQRWRVTLNHLDSRYFRDNVQTKNSTLSPDAVDQAAESESQKRIARAVRLIHDEFSGDWTDEDRLRFARWLTDEVSVVKVRVSEHSIGYRVFLVLNKRGKPLSDHDIMKSAFFERAGFTDAEAVRHSHTWNEYANRLGSDAFEDMLKQIRFLYDRNMKGEFVETLLHVVMSSMPVSTFINQMLPRFVDAYDAVVLGNQDRMQFAPEVARSLCFLRSIHHESWRAPAIKYLVENPRNDEEAARFFAGLERLAYMLQYAVKERDYRHKRYRRVLDAMDQEGAIFEPHSPLQPTPEEKARFRDRLQGRFPNFKQRRALVLRLNAAVPGGVAIPGEADATLEHIFPRTPPKNSSWLEHWQNPDDIQELTECLGNFTLLPDALNQKADRLEFSKKMELYFPDGGQPHFAVSNDLRGLSDFTPKNVRERRDMFVNYLAREWDL
ncbi:MAG: DUF262 domain-containing protein [Alphaproteobacteria bacterium]|nr:DUF262 domain-containing protein [Alphaproteobacteria bacterium]